MARQDWGTALVTKADGTQLSVTLRTCGGCGRMVALTDETCSKLFGQDHA